VILDAHTLFSYFDARADGHWSVAGNIEFVAGFEQLVVSPFVIAELEQIVREEHGLEGWLAVLSELAGGAWSIATVDSTHLAAVRERVADGASMSRASVDVLTAGPSPG